MRSHVASLLRHALLAKFVSEFFIRKVAASNEDMKHSRFIEWMQRSIDGRMEKKFQLEAPRLADVMKIEHQRNERILVAKRDLQEGQFLMRLPIDSLINGYSAAQFAKALPGVLKPTELLGLIRSQTWVALYLMEQKRLGSTSPWAPYLELLPQTFPTLPLMYNDTSWEWIKGSSFQHRVDKHRSALYDHFRLVSEHIPAFNSTYKFDDFLWARMVVSSRAFGWNLPELNKDVTDFMVPLGDIMNHGNPHNVEYAYNSTTRTVDYWMHDNVAAGEELLDSYGTHCNSHYMLHYGFALPDVSSHPESPSTVKLLMDVDADVEDRGHRLQWLRRRSASAEISFAFEPAEFQLPLVGGWTHDGPARIMLAYARLLSLPGGKKFNQRMKRGGSCRSSSTPPRCDQPISVTNEKASVKRCFTAIHKALGEYETSLETDEDLLPRLEGLPRYLTLLGRDEKLVLQRWRHFFDIALEAFSLVDGKRLRTDLELRQLANKAFGMNSEDGHYIRVTLSSLFNADQIATSKQGL